MPHGACAVHALPLPPTETKRSAAATAGIERSTAIGARKYGNDAGESGHEHRPGREAVNADGSGPRPGNSTPLKQPRRLSPPGRHAHHPMRTPDEPQRQQFRSQSTVWMGDVLGVDADAADQVAAWALRPRAGSGCVSLVNSSRYPARRASRTAASSTLPCGNDMVAGRSPPSAPASAERGARSSRWRSG